MQMSRSVIARPLVVLAAAVMTVGLAVGPAGAEPASAAKRTGAAFITNNTLTITGTNGPDAVALSADAAEIQVALGDPTNVQRFALADFGAISVSLGNGDDRFDQPLGVLADKTLTVRGGNGNDIINSGDGADMVFGDNGDDDVDAGRGTDAVYLGNGNDAFVWRPGQGSDVVDGGHGTGDVLEFVGTDQNETMQLSPNGSQAVLLRSPGTIRIDMNELEIVDLRTFGGTDDVSVDDLGGTAVRQAIVDFAATAGGGDQVADVVTVTGTDGDDRVDVRAQDGRVLVGGLRPDSVITGSDALDRLQVSTLGGIDDVRIAPEVAALIAVVHI